MKVYHGSHIAVENIDFSFCRKRRDFGRGFYVTGILSQAGYRANRKIVRNRTNKSDRQAYDCDMIEGPLADDDIVKRVYDYINGEIAKSKFIEELKFRTVTHQICFCTMRSLQALTQDRYRTDAKIIETDKQIIKQLITDGFFSEFDATDKYYSSNASNKLSDEAIKLYLKPWQEIYEMLKKRNRLEINNMTTIVLHTHLYDFFIVLWRNI